ncbi:stage V sporulation protein AA [Gorillibacterium sp. sgz5001074]|uniref:stage V sporulation protein AA n=1 Tax=Gorillibacterium sp. sgz5001074 TaxID=3446695 RepID=UPI003F66530B
MVRSTETPCLYLRFRKRITVRRGEPVTLGKVAQILTEPELETRVTELLVTQPQEKDGNLILVDMMQVVKLVRELDPRMQVEHFGDPHTIVEIAERERKRHPLLIAAVWLLLFIGSGLAIMNFHEDVSMPEVHLRIYELLTGERPTHPYWLQIPYSFGIGAGMILFFNHWFKRKFNEEPSPLEVEMFLYQQNMNHYVVAEEYAKMPPGGGKET